MRVAMDRHARTEIPGTISHCLFHDIEDHLSERHDIVHVPFFYKYLDVRERQVICDSLRNCDAIIISSNSDLLPRLRQQGWRGRALYFALGDLPRGGTLTRNLLPFLLDKDYIILSSQADKELYDRLVLKSAPTVVTIPLNVNPNLYKMVSTEEASELRSLWGFNEDQCVFIYWGRMTVERNLHGLLDCFAQVLRRVPNAILLLVGQPQDSHFTEFGIDSRRYANSLATIASQLKLRSSVRFIPLPNREQLVEIAAISDVFVNLTLHDDNFRVSQLEAMMCGLPVICTKWGVLKEININEMTGFSVDCWWSPTGIRYDKETAIDKMCYLASNPEQRARMGLEARKTILQQYTDFSLVNRVEELLSVESHREIVKTQYSCFGEEYNKRFSSEETIGGTVSKVPVSPRYNHYCDEDYRISISHYMSCEISSRLSSLETSKVWLTSSYLHRVGESQYGVIYADLDLLWPNEHEVDTLSAKILDILRGCDILTWKELCYQLGKNISINSTNDAVRSLILSGLIGITEVKQ